MEAQSGELKPDQYGTWMRASPVRKAFTRLPDTFDASNKISPRRSLTDLVTVPPTASCNLPTDKHKEVQVVTQHPSPISLSAKHVSVPLQPHLSKAAPRDEHMPNDQMTPQVASQVVEVPEEQQMAPTTISSRTKLVNHAPPPAQEMDSSAPLINVPILEDSTPCVSGGKVFTLLPSQQQVGTGKTRKKWKRTAGKENQEVQTLLNENGESQLGKKRLWQLRDESDVEDSAALEQRGKRLHSGKQIVTLQVEEASLNWPQSYK